MSKRPHTGSEELRHGGPAADTAPPPDEAAHGIARRFGYLLGAAGVREILQAAFLIYLARRSAITYGEFILALGLGYLVLTAAELGLNPHLTVLLARGRERPPEILGQITLLKIVLYLAAMAGLLGYVLWQGYSVQLTRVALIVGAGVGLEALVNSFLVDLRVQGRQAAEGRIKSLAALLGFGYGLAALHFGAPAVAVALFKPIEAVAGLVMSVLAARKPALPTIGGNAWRELWSVWRGGLLFTVIFVCGILYNKINILFLQAYAGAPALAQYGAANQIADGINALAAGLLLRDTVFPLLASMGEADGPKRTRVARDSARWLLAAALAIMFLLWAEADRLIPLIYGAAYADSVWLLCWLTPAIALGFLHNLAVYLMISLQRTRLLTLFYLGGLAFNLACCGLLIPAAPLPGAALSLILTKGIMALATVSFCQRRLGLFRKGQIWPLTAAVAGGLAIYWAGRRLPFREIGEALALLPLGCLAWAWWRRTRKAGWLGGSV